MKWKICGDYFHKVHLKIKGEDRTLCGRPQENYDTVEGEYELEKVIKRHNHAVCKKCKRIATRFESNSFIPSI